ncbi:YkgJ family cysteine cluster protein [bacterium]|nr:YkgJ family cysteine cluster protein [bacterium]
MDVESLKNYKTYIDFIMGRIDKFFEKEKPYIACKRGCAKCCKNAEFPFSNIEFDFLMLGFYQLDDETKNKIRENVKKTLELKKENKEETFLYTCPFLIDNVCSNYDYRGIICRTFGLITEKDGKSKVPFCCFEGLNYSAILSDDKKGFSDEKIKELGLEDPSSFNVRYEFLTSDDFGNSFKFKFGDKKAMIDWFENLKF